MSSGTFSIGKLPMDDEHNGWALTIPGRTPRPALKGEVKADLLVVGAGFAGLAAAWHYARERPNERVVVLDAQTVGDGASGRNSGFVLGVKHYAHGADPSNLEPAIRIRRMSQAATRFLGEIVERHQIRCDWKADGMYIAAGGAKGEEAIGRLAEELRLIGEESRVMTGAEALKETGAANYRAMLYSANCVLMQPVKLVRGLADHLPANVTLHERSAVTRIAYGDRIRAETADGAVTAPKVVLAVNLFAPSFGFWKQRVFPLHLFASITRPLTGKEQEALGAKPWGILPAIHTTSPTMRYTEDRRILMRAQYTVSLGEDPAGGNYQKTRAHHEQLFRLRFPMLPDVTFEHTWCGVVCLSRNYGHGTKRQAPNVFTAVCDNAVGATKAVASGIVAADMALDRDNPLAADLAFFGEPALLPPSPFFEIGFGVRRGYEAWRDRAEA
ncbi:MAG: FAD-dependent oxidoreductase [Hyphomicrobiaceae bacterium]